MEIKKRNVVIAGMSALVMTASGIGLAFHLNHNINNDCETHEWTQCTKNDCSNFTYDPSMYLYRNTTECDVEYKPIEIDDPYYMVSGALCPQPEDEVSDDTECKQVAIDVFNKQGTYRTNNGMASKCYYDTRTASVHYNPSEHARESAHRLLSICKNQSST